MKHYPKFEQLHSITKSFTQKATTDLHLVCGESYLDVRAGEIINVYQREFDWGQVYTAWQMWDGEIYIKNKSVGLVPAEYLREVREEIEGL